MVVEVVVVVVGCGGGGGVLVTAGRSNTVSNHKRNSHSFIVSDRLLFGRFGQQ